MDERKETTKRIRLKCRYDGEIRTVIISPEYTFDQLKKRLTTDYGFEVSLKYEDHDGDLIILSSQNDFADLLLQNTDTITVIVSESLLPNLQLQKPGLTTPTRSRSSSILFANGNTSPTSQSLAVSPQVNKEWPKTPTNNNGNGNEPVRNNSLVRLATANSRGYDVSSRGFDRFPTIDNFGAGNDDKLIRWKKGEMLGQGAFGVVYLGLNIDSGELMAVKQMATDDVSTKELSSLENEISLLRNLRHPNIVRYIGTEVSLTALSIFLEYVPGGSLKSLINKFGALDESVAKSYTRQLLLGLEYLHRNGIAHRDIKGANCLVGNDGVIKLADFGNSKQWRQNTTTGGGTQSGDIKGTPSWMAPEVIKEQGGNISWRKADVWSLACTTLEMCTGKAPWSQFSNSVTILYHIACQDTLPEYPQNVSVELVTFLNVCLQRDPIRRPDITSLLLHPFVTNMGQSSGWSTAAGARPTTVSTTPAGEWDMAGWRNTPDVFNRSGIPRSRTMSVDMPTQEFGRTDPIRIKTSQEFSSLDNLTENFSLSTIQSQENHEIDATIRTQRPPQLNLSIDTSVERQVMEPVNNEIEIDTYNGEMERKSRSVSFVSSYDTDASTNMERIHEVSSSYDADYSAPIDYRTDVKEVKATVKPVKVTATSPKNLRFVDTIINRATNASPIQSRDRSDYLPSETSDSESSLTSNRVGKHKYGGKKSKKKVGSQKLKKGSLHVLSSSPIDDEVSQINSSKVTSGVIESNYEFVNKDNNLDSLYDSDDGGYAGSRKSWGSASVTDLDDSGDGIYEDLEASIDGDLNDSKRLSSSFSPLLVPMKKTASFSDALLIKKTEELLDETRWGVEIKSIQEDEWDPSTTKLERIRAPVSAKDGKVPRKGGLSAKTLIKTTSGKRHWSSNDKSLSTLTKELNGLQAKSKQSSTATIDVEKQIDLPLLDQKPKNIEQINRNRRMSGKGTLGEPNMNDDLELVGASLDFPRDKLSMEYNDITRDRSSSLDYSNSDDKIVGDEQNFRRNNKEKIEAVVRSKDTCANYDVNNSTFDDSNNEFTRATILDEHTSSVTRLRCPNKAAALISSSSDGTVKLWVPGDVESRVTLDAINFMSSGDSKSTSSRAGIKVLDVWSHESCEHIWGACSDGAIRLWSGPDLKATRFLKGHDDAITTMEGIEGIGPQSSHLICTGSLDKSIRVWDGRAKKAQIFLFKGHADSVLELRWGEGGRSVVSASKDKSIRIWDTRAGRQRLVIEKHFGAVNGLRAIPEGLGRGVLRGDSLSFISCGRDSHLNLWSSGGECVGTQAAHRGSIHYISDINYNLNCRSSTMNVPIIISCGGENSIKLWDVRKFKSISELTVPASNGTVTKLGWWGQNLITATNSGSIKMWSYIPGGDDNGSLSGKNDSLSTKIEWIGKDIQSHNQAVTDVVAAKNFFATASKNGQILLHSNL